MNEHTVRHLFTFLTLLIGWLQVESLFNGINLVSVSSKGTMRYAEKSVSLVNAVEVGLLFSPCTAGC